MAAFSEALRELRPTLRLALPITAGHVGQILLGLTDSIMIGRVGAVPLAGAAFAGAVFTVALLVGIGLLTPVAVRAAAAHGAGEPREAGESLRHGLVIAVGAAMLLAGVLTGVAANLGFFGQPPEVAAEARAYLCIIAWSLVPVLAQLAVKNYYEALHKPWVPLYWVLGGVGLNVGLNWVLIYGHLGMPALGLTGAGWATLTSRLVVVAGLFCHLQRCADLAAFHPTRWLAPLQRAELRAQFTQGWPVSLQLFFESSLFSVSAIFMGWLGTVSLAAHQIALNCASTTFMIPLGVSHALAVRIGHARGAGRGHLLRVIGFGGVGTSAAIMTVFGVGFICAGALLAHAFIDDKAVVALAAKLLVVAGFFQIFDGTQVAAMGALRGLGDVRWPTVITFFGYWFCAIPAAWALAFATDYGPIGVWSGMALGLALCAVMLVARFGKLTRAPAAGA